MNTYTLFWLTGQSKVVSGSDVAQAMTLAGYGHGALAALDFYGPGDIEKDYKWNAKKRSWIKIDLGLK